MPLGQETIDFGHSADGEFQDQPVATLKHELSSDRLEAISAEEPFATEIFSVVRFGTTALVPSIDDLLR
jgi:hypothetical protein